MYFFEFAKLQVHAEASLSTSPLLTSFVGRSHEQGLRPPARNYVVQLSASNWACSDNMHGSAGCLAADSHCTAVTSDLVLW